MPVINTFSELLKGRDSAVNSGSPFSNRYHYKCTKCWESSVEFWLNVFGAAGEQKWSIRTNTCSCKGYLPFCFSCALKCHCWILQESPTQHFCAFFGQDILLVGALFPEPPHFFCLAFTCFAAILSPSETGYLSVDVYMLFSGWRHGTILLSLTNILNFYASSGRKSLSCRWKLFPFLL